MTPVPCPFCGLRLEPSARLMDGEPVNWNHPDLATVARLTGKKYCMMQGHSIGAKLIEYWNDRANDQTPVCHYELVEKLPVFNSERRGYPATISFLNDCFDFLRRNTTWKSGP